MAYTGGGIPRWLAREYPGLEGINTGLGGFNTLLNDPGFKQLTQSQAADPAAQQYQAASDSGAGSASAPGLFGRLVAGQMGANVTGQASQDAGQNAAQKGRVNALASAGNAMAGQQESDIALQTAQDKSAVSNLGLLTTGLKMLINPDVLGFSKGLFSNIAGGGTTAGNALGVPQPLDSGAGAVPESPQSLGGSISESSIAGSSGDTPLISAPADTTGLPIGTAAGAAATSSPGFFSWLMNALPFAA